MAGGDAPGWRAARRCARTRAGWRGRSPDRRRLPAWGRKGLLSISGPRRRQIPVNYSGPAVAREGVRRKKPVRKPCGRTSIHAARALQCTACIPGATGARCWTIVSRRSASWNTSTLTCSSCCCCATAAPLPRLPFFAAVASPPPVAVAPTPASGSTCGQSRKPTRRSDGCSDASSMSTASCPALPMEITGMMSVVPAKVVVAPSAPAAGMKSTGGRQSGGSGSGGGSGSCCVDGDGLGRAMVAVAAAREGGSLAAGVGGAGGCAAQHSHVAAAAPAAPASASAAPPWGSGIPLGRYRAQVGSTQAQAGSKPAPEVYWSDDVSPVVPEALASLGTAARRRQQPAGRPPRRGQQDSAGFSSQPRGPRPRAEGRNTACLSACILLPRAW